MTNTGDLNTGLHNTGRYNTGNRNTGSHNTGHSNTGFCNTGFHNTGNWNAGDSHVGCFNTVDAEIAYYFNKLLPVEAWYNAYKPAWLYGPMPTTWVNAEDMTDEERAANPTHETTGGYLRKNDMKQEWRKAYASASPEDIQAVRDLPGFDYDVFEEITGLDLREKPMSATCEGLEFEGAGLGDNKLRYDNLWYSKPDLHEKPMSATCEGREVDLDGVTYVLNGKQLSEAEWRKQVSKPSCEGREIEIDGVTYVLKVKGKDDATNS